MKIETFFFTHPIRAVIHDQNLHFIGGGSKRLSTVHRQGILLQLEGGI